MVLNEKPKSNSRQRYLTVVVSLEGSLIDPPVSCTKRKILSFRLLFINYPAPAI